MMDDLLEALNTTSISGLPNSTSAEHPRFASYKATKVPSQTERREKFLKAQKQRRFDAVNYARKLAVREVGNNDSDDNEEDEVDEMDITVLPKRNPRTYQNQLMLSEWLVEVPDDFTDKWLLMPCPIGKRCLVISAGGTTKAYSRSGYMLNTFPSHLPGGCRKTRETGSNYKTYTLLDCVYNEMSKTYFILDVMCWNSHQVYDSDTEFRFYWIKTKIDECPSVSEICSSNPYKFTCLPYYACDAATIATVVNSPLSFPCELDGLLFYHKELHYVPGAQTPLIGWLKIYHVPDILNITIATELCTEKQEVIDHATELFAAAHKKHDAIKALEKTVMHIDVA